MRPHPAITRALASEASASAFGKPTRAQCPHTAAVCIRWLPLTRCAGHAGTAHTHCSSGSTLRAGSAHTQSEGLVWVPLPQPSQMDTQVFTKLKSCSCFYITSLMSTMQSSQTPFTLKHLLPIAAILYNTLQPEK